MKSISITIILLFSSFISNADPFVTTKWQTANNAHAILYSETSIPMLDINIAFTAGSAYDGNQFGLSALTTNLLDKGNNHFNADQIAEQFATIGAQFATSTTKDMIIIHLRTLTNKTALQQAIKTLALIINHPDFTSRTLNNERNRLLLTIKHDEESIDSIGNDAMLNAIYQHHPYAHSVIGTTKTVTNINNWHVRNFYKRYFVGSNATIVLAGDINQEQAHAITDKLLAKLPTGIPAPNIALPPKTQHKIININFPTTQTLLLLGHLGITYNDADYFPLLVGNYILGGPTMTSRLINTVREQYGLTYNINSNITPLLTKGTFIISLATQNQQAQQALTLTTKVLNNFLKNPVTRKDLVTAKKYLIGSFPLSLASNNNIANILLQIEFYHLPENFLTTYLANINAVSATQIQAAFNRIIQAQDMIEINVHGKN